MSKEQKVDSGLSSQNIGNTNVSRRFSLDTNGYQEAKNWLKEIGQWEYVSTHGFSTDGYSIVEEANAIWNKRNQIN